jgi:hypothetical protein
MEILRAFGGAPTYALTDKRRWRAEHGRRDRGPQHGLGSATTARWGRTDGHQRGETDDR